MSRNKSRCDGFLEWTVAGSFTSLGYKVRSRHWDPIPDDSLTGKVVVVTGATSGIGRAAAIEAARRGARLRFIARSEEKSEQLVAQLMDALPRADVRYYLADLSIIAAIDKVCDEILTAEPCIDVLVNNAGVLPHQRIATPEGLELAYATDLVGPFVLTNRLRDRLVTSSPARIINVVSGGMYTQALELDDPTYVAGKYHGSVAYARAKRGLMVLTKMWADQLAGTGVTVNATHPGWVDTPGVRSSLPGFYRITRPLLRTVEQGADTILWLATSPEGGERSGLLWHDRVARSEYRSKRTIETSAERNHLWQQLSETVDRIRRS